MTSKVPLGSSQEETVAGFLDGFVRFALFVSGIGILGSLGLILLVFFSFSSGQATADANQAIRNLDSLGIALIVSALIFMAGMAYAHWGEEVLSPLLLIGAALVFFLPDYLPMIVSTADFNVVTGQALSTVRNAGAWAGGAAVLVMLLDIGTRVRDRVVQGSRADQLRYGKDIREQADIRNVFLGKCWQLPFCRKFVRERCPIYHSRRTCWKERVGCMCEEQVIANALEGKVIPRDVVAAAKYIPRNAKLTPAQKAERCRQCVIYNEHQKHKYKLALPLCVGLVAGSYVLFKPQLLALMAATIEQGNRFIRTATAGATRAATPTAPGFDIFQEVMLVCLMLIVLAYLMKVVEFFVFKLKI